MDIVHCFLAFEAWINYTNDMYVVSWLLKGLNLFHIYKQIIKINDLYNINSQVLNKSVLVLSPNNLNNRTTTN